VQVIVDKKDQYFDRYAQDYDRHLADSTAFFTRKHAYFARYKALVIKQTSSLQPVRILDFGCGTGRNIPFLAEAFPEAEILGCDISEESLKEAKENFPQAVFFHNDAPEVNTGDFDLIVVSCVLHHIPVADRAGVVRNLAARLSPQGELYILEHNPWNPLTRMVVNNCEFDADAVLLTRSETGRLFTGSGLWQLKKSGYILFFPPFLHVPLWLELQLSFLPLGGQYYVCLGRKS
jgi:SAM-dependent methyltransferase